jgi:hypothetical protein
VVVAVIAVVVAVMAAVVVVAAVTVGATSVVPQSSFGRYRNCLVPSRSRLFCKRQVIVFSSCSSGGILTNLLAGQYIKHFQYGCGVITEYNADRTTIDFDAHGIKKFVTSMMVIEPAEGTPPKRRRAKRVKPNAAAAPTVASRVFVPGAK